MYIYSKGLVEFIIEYQKDLLTPDIVDSLETFHNLIGDGYFTDDLYENTKEDVYKAIIELIECPDSFSANRYFQALSDTIRGFVLLRAQYFEKILTEMNNVPVEVPDDPKEVLKWGLIDLWNERQTRSPRYRSN